MRVRVSFIRRSFRTEIEKKPKKRENEHATDRCYYLSLHMSCADFVLRASFFVLCLVFRVSCFVCVCVCVFGIISRSVCGSQDFPWFFSFSCFRNSDILEGIRHRLIFGEVRCTLAFCSTSVKIRNMLSQESQKMCFECSVAIKCELLKKIEI